MPDTITYYDLPNTLTIYNGGRSAHRGQTTGLYDTDKLTVYDKYAMFLHGNNGLSRIEGDGTGRILVIKDSYANCFAPYLTANYAQIDVVDFRNYNYGLDQLIADNDYDQILVLYNFDSLNSDPSPPPPGEEDPQLKHIVYFHKFIAAISCVPPVFCTDVPKPLDKNPTTVVEWPYREQCSISLWV